MLIGATTSIPPDNPNGIVVRGATKRFGDVLALPPIDITAPPGAVTLLTGRNGAGKTTLLRILASLVTRDRGEVWVDGLDPSVQGHQVRERIGLAMVNDRAVYWRLTVGQNLMLVAKLRNIPRDRRRSAVQAALSSVGLVDLIDRPAYALSSGQRQRAVLCRALLGEPSVLLIDEPLRGLDDEAAALVLATLQCHAERGATVLIASPTANDFADLASAHATVPDRESETVT